MAQANGELERRLAAAQESHRAGRFAEAEADYLAALVLSPGHPAILENLGASAAAQGRRAAALDYFSEAIAADPRYAAAHYNLGVLLWYSGRAREAIDAFERVCALEPDHYEAHRALGFLWLAEGGRGRSLDHFARTYELRRGEDRAGLAAQSLTCATRQKLAHDAEQFRHLSKKRRGGEAFELMARAYEAAASLAPEQAAPLSAEMRRLVGGGYNSAIASRDAPEIPGGVLAPRADLEAIERGFAQDACVVIDDLLTQSALCALRGFLLESTIWHDFSHIGGFLACYLEDGFACPLALQVADEIRQAFPHLLGERPLSQAWAFKSLSSSGAVAAHADDAAVSLNLWVTPDAANLDPAGGGLVICRAPPPADWTIAGYDADRAAIEAFLAERQDETLHVPYRENRAVLFDSRLFHRSDAPTFAAGYENHRINVTFLFGAHAN